VTDVEWSERATARAIAGVRKLVASGRPVPPATPVGRLNDRELGWIVVEAVLSWLSVRAEQSAAMNLSVERVARWTSEWDVAATRAILPVLAELPVDWNRPLGSWSRDEIVRFLTQASALIRGVTESGATITRKPDTDLNDPVSF
jgi:hypothetical protein